MAPYLVRAQSAYKDIRIDSFHHTHKNPPPPRLSTDQSLSVKSDLLPPFLWQRRWLQLKSNMFLAFTVLITVEMPSGCGFNARKIQTQNQSLLAYSQSSFRCFSTRLRAPSRQVVSLILGVFTQWRLDAELPVCNPDLPGHCHSGADSTTPRPA